MALEQLLLRVEVFLALAAALAVLKSFYNGVIHRALEAIGMVPEIQEQVRHIDEEQDKLIEKQEDQLDAILAVAIAQGEDRLSIETDRLIQSLRNDEGSERFLRDDPDPYRYGEYSYHTDDRVDVRDEREGPESRGPKVDEPRPEIDEP